MSTSDVPAGMEFTTSSYSAGTGSVEASLGPAEERTIAVRHSSLHDEVLVFTTAEWEAFIRGVKDGEFDLPDGGRS
jgi:hypothetical protein